MSTLQSGKSKFTTAEDDGDNVESVYARLIQRDLDATLRDFVRNSVSFDAVDIRRVAEDVLHPLVWRAVIDYADPTDVQAYLALCVHAATMLDTSKTAGSSAESNLDEGSRRRSKVP